jgi:hypothetical protein
MEAFALTKTVSFCRDQSVASMWLACASPFVSIVFAITYTFKVRVLSSFEVIIITPSIIIKNPEHHNNRPLSIRIHCFGWHRIH